MSTMTRKLKNYVIEFFLLTLPSLTKTKMSTMTFFVKQRQTHNICDYKLCVLLVAVAHDPKNPSLFVRTFMDNLINFNSSNFFFHLASNFNNYKVFISSKLEDFILKYTKYAFTLYDLD